ncbi:lipopolysaccharide kinase InaA family protein [Natroniella sp. ANB-PHB2]|uniref:lipopolysaccharide kinase InaA family protein n=1 Tax=Natroniella sp. ANB-PHB2 TaxID=3384444 RepID=UPI0038D45607
MESLRKIDYGAEVNLYLNQNFDLRLDEIKEKIESYLNISKQCDFFYLKRNRKVIKSDLQGRNIYAKSYSPLNAKKWYDKLRDLTLFKSVARKEMEALLILKRANLPVIEPVLVIERKLSVWVTESIIVTCEFEGVGAEEIIFSAQYNYQLKKAIMEEVAKNLIKIHQADIVHCDYRFRNILVNLSKNKGFELAVIDLERARVNYKWKYRRVKDWAKLIADWLKALSALSINKQEKIDLIESQRQEYKEKVKLEYQLNNLEMKLLDKWINKILK